MLASTAVYAFVVWRKREKWNQDQKDARHFLRELGELKICINEARPALQVYPYLTDSLLAEKGIEEKVSNLSKEQKEFYEVHIYYSDHLKKNHEHRVRLRVMKDIINALGWDKGFAKNIEHIEVLITVFEYHAKSHQANVGKTSKHSYFYWDIDKYNKCKEEEGENTWVQSIEFGTQKEGGDQDKYKKCEEQKDEVMRSLKILDRPQEKGNFFDKEIDEVFNNLFDLLSKKIGKKKSCRSQLVWVKLRQFICKKYKNNISK
ncbi:MAG: hypothetical protein OXU23_28275 [Candidatus Poribacteria bacterium]|nr:hypothetical protein [Candidatus Poribacteria bacterium]